MAAEGKTPRNPLDSALVDRSRAAPNGMRSPGPELTAARGKRVYGAAGLRSSKASLSAMTKSELDDIYSLGSDDDDGEQDSRRRKMLKKAKTDVGNRTRATHGGIQPTLPPLKATTLESKPTLQRSTSDISSKPPTIQRRAFAASSSDTRVPSTQAIAGGAAATISSNSRRRPKSPVNHTDQPRAPISRTMSEGSLLKSLPRAPSPTKPSIPARKPKPGRIRLIDRLAAQVEESSDSDVDRDIDGQRHKTLSMKGDLHSTVNSPTTPQRGGESAPKLSTQPAQSVRRTNVKTYSQQRSIRTESGDDNVLGGLGSLDADLTPSTKLGKLDAFSFDDDEMEDVRPKGGILGLHALRQAGANHRFSNDLNDLFERVGVPRAADSASARSRRSALLELGRKLQERKFVSQFCDDGSKDAIFRQIGNEKDLINAFVLVSALIVLLAHSAAPHLVDQLFDGGLDKLLARMLDVDSDITDLARQRQSNLSKHGQACLQTLKSALIQSNNIWGPGVPPAKVSTRTLALKALSMSCKTTNAPSTAEALRLLTPSLFSVVRAGRARLEEAGSDEQSYLLDLELSLSLLQGISVAALESEDSSHWLDQCLPSIAAILSSVVDVSTPEVVEVESQALKLAMNTSNSALSAGMYGSDRLLRKLARVALLRFQELHSSVSQGKFPTDLYGRLVLVLGLLINVTEHSPSSRERIGSWEDSDTSSLEGLVTIYLDHRESSGKVRARFGICGIGGMLTISKADSYEQTSLAVAHGYLAILLGYISMDDRTRRWLLAKSGGKGTQYLLSSIREFMALHEKVADAATDDMATSLGRLVNELQVKSRTEA